MKSTLALLAAAGLAFGATAAHADQITVTHDDLNLNSPGGQKVLQHRIDKAARAVCGVTRQETGTRLRDRAARECFETARAQAHAQFAQLTRETAKGG